MKRKEISFKKAKRLSVEAWKYKAKTGCDYREWEDYAVKKKEEYRDLKNYCGLCEYAELDCKVCPLSELWGMDCDDENSEYREWAQEKSIVKRREMAGKILADIKSLEEK